MKKGLNTPQGQQAIDINLDSVDSPKTAGRILNSPGRRLPNVKSFKIKIKAYDELFKEFGIKKRLAPEMEFTLYKNNKINRYLEHQVIRLDKARVNPVLYGRIAGFLMRNSTAFRVIAGNHVYKNGHRNLPFSFVMSTNNRVDALMKEEYPILDYERVYLEETNKVRPLGVPRPEFRIYLHMFAQFITYYTSGTMPNQHAFIPGYGTLTAGKQIILSGALGKRNIREGDFKGFFDNINPLDISDELRKRRVPDSIIQRLHTLNTSEIKLPIEVLRDEGYERDIEMIRKVLEYQLGKPIEQTEFWNYRELAKSHPVGRHVLRRTFESLVANGTLTHNEKTLRARLINTKIGVPQGAATSPILANLIMQKWLDSFESQRAIAIGYADDSITASDREIEAPRVHPVINGEKSHYVKKDGIWLKPLKFLGLVGDGKNMYASTRKGSKLLLNEEIKRLMDKYILRNKPITEKEVDEAFKNLEKDKKDYNRIASKSGENYFKSKIIGFIQARLYSNSGNLENLEQDFNLSFSKSSGMNTKLNKMKDPTVFISSSYASHSLANILGFKKRRQRLNKFRFRLKK